MQNTAQAANLSGGVFVRGYEGILGSVCDGIGKRLNMDPNWLRGAFIFGVVLFGFGLVLYLFAWIFLPKDGEEELAREAKILGVCYAISNRYKIGVGLVRIITALLVVNSIGLGIILYIIAYLILENSSWQKYLDN